MSSYSATPSGGYAVWCPYCGKQALMVDCSTVYNCNPGKYGNIYVCADYPDCDSYVGTHPGTNKPLGSMANGPLRRARRQAHEAFDATWQDRLKSRRLPLYGTDESRQARRAAYEWLAREMELTIEKCHIGEMDWTQCKRVIFLCSPKRERHPEFL